MDQSIALSLIQALQIVALAPCLLVIVHLVSTVTVKKFVLIPVLYFIALSYGFIYYLVPVFTQANYVNTASSILLYGESFIPAISFLLIYQFITNRLPSIVLWLILLIPAFEALPFVYNAVYNEKFCIAANFCLNSNNAFHINYIVIAAIMFFAATILVALKSDDLDTNKTLRHHKYIIIVVLIVFNLGLMALDLRYVQGRISIDSYIYSKTFIKIAFIYMVVSSVFRVFSDTFYLQSGKTSAHKTPLDENDIDIIDKLEQLLSDKKVYRESGFNRASLAEMLGIKEHQLSRIINLKFNKSFSEVANDYRIEEAKMLILQSDQPITAISFDVGFSSIATFNRVFKEVVGMSPTDFRERNKENKKEDNNAP